MAAPWIASSILLTPGLGGHAVRESGFNPSGLFGPGEITYGLYFFHLLGLVVVGPIVEEVFWRGFLMRYLLNNRDFQSVTIGWATPISFLITTSLIALAHGQRWPQAMASATVLGLWFVMTRGLGNVMAAHAMANLTLGVYVLLSKSWFLW